MGVGPDASGVNALRTSDWDRPNCRAINDGLMPALNAARTALTCPRVNETVATSTCRLWGDLAIREVRFCPESPFNVPILEPSTNLPQNFVGSLSRLLGSFRAALDRRL